MQSLVRCVHPSTRAKTVELVVALFRLLKVSQLHRADERWRVKTPQSCSIRRCQLRHSVTLSSLARWAVYSETCETTHPTLSKLLSQAGRGTQRHDREFTHTGTRALTGYHLVRHNTSIFGISLWESLMTGWGVSNMRLCMCVYVSVLLYLGEN